MDKITVTPYMAGTVNHATNNETAKITDTIYLAPDTVMEREESLRREQYCARRNRETAEERIKAGNKKSTRETMSEHHDFDRAVTHIVAVEKSS